MARTLSAALLTAQQSSSRKPAIRININSVDYSDRLLFVEHHEDPYRDYATIILNNADRGLDAVATASTNLLGYRFRIAYGYYTGETVAEPNGDGAGNEYVESADLWVKRQQMVSSEGQLVCQLYCEGQWERLREQHIMALANVAEGPEGIEGVDPDEVGTNPYFTSVFEWTKTVHELLEAIIENAMGWTLNAASSDIPIIYTFKPYFSLDGLPLAAVALKDLIYMTACFLRPKANLTWDIVYPQSTDSVDETYYSSEAPYFLEYAEALNLTVPNRIVVFAGNPDDLEEWPEPVIVGDTGAYSGNYDEILEAHVEPRIKTQEDANGRADAILARYKAESLAGYLIVHHDARVELYDRVQVDDRRGQ